jgi:diaminobutyrate acetyltransferase
MWRLADGAVDRNSPYSYLMMCEHFADTCAVGTIDGTPIAFVTGFRLPADPETVFVWQIVTSSEARGTGVATGLLDHLADSPTVPRTRHIEATVTPGNAASLQLFRGFARRRGTACEESLLFAADDFPIAHDAEHRLRIGPF